MAGERSSGVFVGLVTLDLIYQIERLPQSNEKQVALQATLAAGGPATNAAIVFARLTAVNPGRTSSPPAITHLVGWVGQHPLTSVIREDLSTGNVQLLDLAPPDWTAPPPASSILVTQATGDRAVVSLNATRIQAQADGSSFDTLFDNILADAAIVLIDGHQIAVSTALAAQAKTRGIPVVLDGGSWKPGLEAILPYIDYAICSANFQPPDAAVVPFLQSFGIPNIAITHGSDPIEFWQLGESGSIPVLPIKPVDTLGAGDVFHGAFCYWILHTPFALALERAGAIASRSCQSFGTRQFLTDLT